MSETYKCETNIFQEDCSHKVKYYLITDDGINFGIKSTVYENQQLISTDVFKLTMSREKVEKLITTFCENHVFPQSFTAIIADMFQ